MSVLASSPDTIISTGDPPGRTTERASGEAPSVSGIVQPISTQPASPTAPPPPVTGGLIDGAQLVDGWYALHVSDTGTIDTDFTKVHALGFTPTFYRVIRTSVAGALYNAAAGFTADQDSITLRYSGANADLWLAVI